MGNISREMINEAVKLNNNESDAKQVGCGREISAAPTEAELRRALIIFNPIAGENRAMKILPAVIKHMTEKGYISIALTTTGPGAATEYVVRFGTYADIVVCSGGDGTVNEVINGLMQLQQDKRPRFAYIPAGSTNDFANTLGIPKKAEDAISVITDGKCVPVDVGCFNGRYYAYVSAFGAFTDIAYTTSQDAKNIWGPLAYFVKSVGKLKDIRPIRARFIIDGEEIEDAFILCAISNSKIIAGVIKLNPSYVNMSDGLFEIMLIKYPANAIETGKIVNALSTGELKSCEFIRMFHADRIDVTILEDEPISWSLDGECEKDVRCAVIRNVHGALNVMIPAKE